MTERDIQQILKKEPIELKPLQFLRLEPDLSVRGVDAVYDVNWDGKLAYRFVASIKARATSQALAAAAMQAKSSSYDAGGRLPLVIVPYLSPASLDEVERLGISAVDLCGNGVVQVPRQWLIVRSGKPNRFRGTDPLRGAYRGVASLVSRALLVQPRFERVGDVLDFIEARGGRITLATVSKALSRLEEDLVIAREAKTIRLLQADKLLTRLEKEYQSPQIRTRLQLKAPLAEAERRLRDAAADIGARFAPTGIASASRQTVVATEPIATYYCSAEPDELARAASLNPQPEKYFATLELLQTDDERVYFDARSADEGMLASPVQTWLELVTGDKRSQEAANNLRARLQRELEIKSEATNGR